MEARTALVTAETLITASEGATAEDRQSKREAAKREYRRACHEGAGVVRLQACNNLGVALLDDGETEEAGQVLASVQAEMVKRAEPGLSPPFLVNQGIVLERKGDQAAAMEVYLEAVSMDASLGAATRAADRAISTLPVERQTVPLRVLVGQLVHQGQADTAASMLLNRLERAGEGSFVSAEALLPEITLFLADARVDAAAFQNTWRFPLESLRPHLSEVGRLRVDAIENAYTSRPPQIDLPHDVATAQAQERAAAWLAPAADRRTFSELLRSLGADRSREARFEEAAADEAWAWRLDPSNMEAALSLVASLQRGSRLAVTERVLSELASNAPLAVQLGDQREAALRLHALLGGIFFERGGLGPPSEPGTAIYHWEEAVHVYRSLGAKPGSEFEWVPVLFDNLGSAYEHYRDPARAFPSYLEAVYGYLRSGYRELAVCSLGRAEALASDGRVAVTPGQRQWMEELRPRLPRDASSNSCDDIAPQSEKVHKAEKAPEPPPPPAPPPPATDCEIRFAFDRSDLTADDRDCIRRFVKERRKGESVEVRVEGHTDSLGTYAYNRLLGLRRAWAVREFLRDLGVPADNIWVTSYGKERLKESAKTEAAQSANRRAVLRVVAQPTGPEPPKPQ